MAASALRADSTLSPTLPLTVPKLGVCASSPRSGDFLLSSYFHILQGLRFSTTGPVNFDHVFLFHKWATYISFGPRFLTEILSRSKSRLLINASQN